MEEKPQDITKFIVLSHGRTGSILLSLALGKHPNVRMFLELFHDDEQERHRSFRADDKVYKDGEDGAKFLREAVFYDRYWRKLKAVGFKIFYDQAHKDKYAEDIHIIHLIRRNLFESWVSYEVALRTDEWAVLKCEKPKSSPLPPFMIDAKKCGQLFKQVMAYRKWARETFHDHPFLEVEYEKNICGHFQAMMQDIQDFLGLPRAIADIPTEKQARLKPMDQVSNYEMLKDYFSHTDFKDFFQSPSETKSDLRF